MIGGEKVRRMGSSWHSKAHFTSADRANTARSSSLAPSNSTEADPSNPEREMMDIAGTQPGSWCATRLGCVRSMVRPRESSRTPMITIWFLHRSRSLRLCLSQSARKTLLGSRFRWSSRTADSHPALPGVSPYSNPSPYNFELFYALRPNDDRVPAPTFYLPRTPVHSRGP
jgi:hypothetical protein